MSRLLTLMLGIAEAEKGTIMIDDIDAGLHYSVMSQVWTVVGKMARDLDVQIFTSTHSWECLKAAHEAFTNGEAYDLSVQRIDRKGEDVRAIRFDREMIDNAVSSGVEMR